MHEKGRHNYTNAAQCVGENVQKHSLHNLGVASSKKVHFDVVIVMVVMRVVRMMMATATTVRMAVRATAAAAMTVAMLECIDSNQVDKEA